MADDSKSGPDLEAMRRRVLERRGEASLSEEGQEELRKEAQVDLDDEKNLELDPQLEAHMESARRRLKEQQDALERGPIREDLRTKYIDVMGQISQELRNLRDRRDRDREFVEELHRYSRALGSLAAGREPHGFKKIPDEVRANPSVKLALEVLGVGIGKCAAAYEDTYDQSVVEMWTRLGEARRNFEAVGDGLLKLLELGEEERRRLREYIQVAGKPDLRAKAPAATLEAIPEADTSILS